jgi:hypothetical protein
MAIIRFNDALRYAAFATRSEGLPGEWPVQIIRDVYGRIRFAVNCTIDEYPELARLQLEAVQKMLGGYATSANVLFRDDFSNPDLIFNSSDCGSCQASCRMKVSNQAACLAASGSLV